MAYGPPQAARPMPAAVWGPILCLQQYIAAHLDLPYHTPLFVGSIPDEGRDPSGMGHPHVGARHWVGAPVPGTVAANQEGLPAHNGETIHGIGRRSLCCWHPCLLAPAGSGSPRPAPPATSGPLEIPITRPGTRDHRFDGVPSRTPADRHCRRPPHDPPPCGSCSPLPRPFGVQALHLALGPAVIRRG